MPRAASLAAELDRTYGVRVTLVKGQKGIFDVWVNGIRIFSKHEEQRFPELGEVVARVAAQA